VRITYNFCRRVSKWIGKLVKRYKLRISPQKISSGVKPENKDAIAKKLNA